MNEQLQIFPRPHKISFSSGFFTKTKNWEIQVLESKFEKVVHETLKSGKQNFSTGNSHPTLLVGKGPHKKNGGYSLEINTDQVCIHASGQEGVFRALNTLAKIVQNSDDPDQLPCTKIEDYPIFKRRGFMLDVSRGKVPTMKSIWELIDLLAKLGYNELQLYVEHTFAFAEHPIVWKEASPLTGDEIRQIDGYCKKKFIELVPNLNSFGHFERWLKHDAYHDLAECPNGFRRDEPFMERDHGSTLKPNQGSLDFMNLLYREYLPNFSSSNFNVGMDEPWELGQGWSADKVKTHGKAKVYLNHLDGIRALVEKYGKHMQFWADVLLEEPENAKLLPPSAKPIIWGYEADHPFDQQAEIISSCDLSFCLAPGTATWRSFSGRWPTARQNLSNAFNNAFKHHAEGILLTSWGDCGNHQPWPIFYPSIFLAAQWGWRNQEIDDQALAKEINSTLWSTASSDPAGILMELGTLDQILDSKIPNASLAWNILFSPQPEKMPAFLKENFTTNKLNQGIEYLKSLHHDLKGINNFEGKDEFQKEISLGIELSLLSLQKGISLMTSFSSPQYNAKEIVKRFENNWMQKARPGGLEESSMLLTDALKAT